MTKERYNYLLTLRGTGELEKDQKLFKELFEFERKAVRTVRYYAIDNFPTVKEASKYLYGLKLDEMIDLAIEHQDIKPSKAALSYLKQNGSIL